MRFLIALFCITSVFYSCQQESVCLTPQVVVTNASFAKRDTANTIRDSVLKGGRVFFGEATIYYNDIISNSAFSFPLSPNKDSIRLYVQTDTTNILPSALDTISISYTRTLAFISVACGYQTFYEIKKVSTTGNQIDSVAISNPGVTNNLSIKHLRLVFKK